MFLIVREASDRPARVNAGLEENLDAEDVPDAGDHALIQQDFPDLPGRLFSQ